MDSLDVEDGLMQAKVEVDLMMKNFLEVWFGAEYRLKLAKAIRNEIPPVVLDQAIRKNPQGYEMIQSKLRGKKVSNA